MPFPDHIERIFETFRVPADTKATLYDLYVSLGDEALEVFGDASTGWLRGYRDKRTKQVVIPPQWSEAWNFSEDRAVVRDGQGLIGFIDLRGSLVIPYRYTNAPHHCGIDGEQVFTSVFRHGKAWVVLPGGYGFAAQGNVDVLIDNLCSELFRLTPAGLALRRNRVPLDFATRGRLLDGRNTQVDDRAFGAILAVVGP